MNQSKIGQMMSLRRVGCTIAILKKSKKDTEWETKNHIIHIKTRPQSRVLVQTPKFKFIFIVLVKSFGFWCWFIAIVYCLRFLFIVLVKGLIYLLFSVLVQILYLKVKYKIFHLL